MARDILIAGERVALAEMTANDQPQFQQWLAGSAELRELIDWPWFIASQFVFGVAAALTVMRFDPHKPLWAGLAGGVIGGALMTLPAVAWGYLSGRGIWYRAGLAGAALFFLYQQWLIRARRPEACFRAFNNNHYVGLAVFVGLALDYLYRGSG